jgi:hypothetical protein
LVSLLRGIGGIHPSHRRTLVDQLLLCRHRDHRTVSKTPLEKMMHFTDETHWFFLHALIIAIRSRLDAKGLSLLQAFHLFDLDGNGLLDSNELWTALHFLGFQAEDRSTVTPNDVQDLMRLSDTGEDGALDFEEFTRAFHTREEVQITHAQLEAIDEDDREEQKSGLSTKLPLATNTSSSVAAPIDLPKLELIQMPAPQRPTHAPAYVSPTGPSSVPPPATAPQQLPSHVSAPAASPWSFPAAGPAASSVAGVPPSQPRSPPIVVATSPWNCGVCTYANGAGRSRCEMCDTPKQ